MKQIQMTVNVRETAKKNAMNRLRQQDVIPAVMYGQGQSAVTLQVSNREFTRALHNSAGSNVLIKLNIEGGAAPQEETVVIREVQRHPVTSKFLHIDFVKILMDKPLEASIPVVLTGTARGLKEGGMLELVHRELMVRCLPNLLPETIALDVTPLQIGEAITVGSLKLGEGIEIMVDAHEPIVHVVAPRAAEEAKPAEGAAAADAASAEVKQPEVIGEKEREERRAEKEKEKDKK